MSNLLAIPFKKTFQVDISTAARDYISNQAGGHPDEFKRDIKAWKKLRDEGTGSTVHISRIESALLYHAQLVSILSKFPTDIHLAIPYTTAFDNNAFPVTLNNLVFERASVVFNLASLYSQLANAEDRSTTDGIKRAAAYYQVCKQRFDAALLKLVADLEHKHAAGTFEYLKTILPQLAYTTDNDPPPDLSDGIISGLELLMLAQAQECSWQMAKLNNYKNTLISKIARRVATLYDSAFTALTDSPQRHIPKDWLTHIQVKGHHFKAVAEFRKSFDEIENGTHYGLELARLASAQLHAQQAFETARRGRITGPVSQDAQSLLETIQKSQTRAQRDNDLIYHQEVPASSALAVIQETNLVASKTPPGLSNPENVLNATIPLFSGLVSWGAKEAINIYNDRKNNLLKEQVEDVIEELHSTADRSLRSMNLPASLEALERPIGLPPSLLRKAEEVRQENGPDRVEASLDNVETLGQRGRKILEEAMGILDTEASEDESTRKEYPINRPPSHEVNVELTDKGERYRHILDQAQDSDETVRQKWYEWEEHIRQLTLDEATLESMVPSTTVSSASQATPQARLTRKHARALRVKLEDLDALRRESEDIARRVRTVIEVDDIRQRVTKAASGFEKMAAVQPVMFEDISDEELSKYDRYLQELAEVSKRQDSILQDINVENEQLLVSRKEDPMIKERELALHTLELAYLKYKEIVRNLDEGNKFYNNLSDILLQFKSVCKTWAQQRNQELHDLTNSLKNMSIASDDNRSTPRSVGPGPPAKRVKPVIGNSSLRLPALTSDEWGFEEIALPPGPKTPGPKSRG